MKRKLLLMAGSFIILLLAFGTYQLFVPGIAFFDPSGATRLRPKSLGVFDPGKGPGFAPTKEITLYYRSPEGQLRGVYKASSWSKEDDGSFTLLHPQAVVYQRDGTRVYLRAQRGRFWAEEVAGSSGFNIRHGQADGKVEIFYDQSTDDKWKGEERPHPKDRPYDDMIHDVLRVVTNDVKFSRDMLELRTDSEVTIWSRQIDMNGKGLLLQWNEDPRELRLLRLEKGTILVVKDLPEQVNLTQLPTEEPPPAETQPTPPPATRPTTKPDDESAWGLVATATKKQRFVRPGRNVNVIVEDRPGQTRRKARTAPPLPKEPKMRNIYCATFHDAVRIFSGNRRLTGADQLALTFEWDRAWKPERNAPSSDSSQNDKTETRPATTRPTTVPTSRPKFASRVAAAGVRDMKLDEDQARKSDRQMVIYWDGPLEILPEGRTETPSRKRYTIAGEGKDVRLSDEDARILCTQFEFKNPQQEAWFEGTKERPARVQLARGDEITCRGRIRFVRGDGKAYLQGPGELVRYARDEEMSNWNLVPVEQAPWRLLLDRITWGEKVVARFGERKVPDKDGEEETRPFIKDAVFHQNVRMVQYTRPTARGEDGRTDSSVSATDRLHVWMGLTEEGKNYPRRVEVNGNVSARIDESNIRAGHVEIAMRPLPKEKRDERAPKVPEPKTSVPVETKQSVTTMSPEAARVAKPDGAPEQDRADSLSAMGGSVEPTEFYASGDVEITYADPNKPNDPPLRIKADMVRASDINTEEKRGLAVLTGTPVAKIWQGDQSIEGEVIRFDRQAEAVKVEGRGEMHFMLDQDLSGNRLQRPRPGSVAWREGMLYHRQGRQCIFTRDVKFDSVGEKISCPKEIRIFFEAEDSGSRDDAQPVPRGSRSLSMGVDQFGKADITSIEAYGGKDDKQWVSMQTRKMHPQNRKWVLLRRQIRGQEILYKVLKDRKNKTPGGKDATSSIVKVNGPGDFLAEDYRKPKKTDNDQRRLGSLNEMGGQVDRPSQTLFRWKKDMLFQQAGRYVRLRDGVVMIHRSGDQMITMPGLQTQPFGTLRGRISTLNAGQVDAWFHEPDEKIATLDEHGRVKDSRREENRELLEGGPDVGKLRLFKAVKDVTMEMADDGSRYGKTIIDGEQVLYDDVKKVIEVTGFLPGAAKRTEAQITVEDRGTGIPPKTIRSPWLIYDLKKDTISIPKLSGGGGR